VREVSEEDIYGYSHRLELALTGRHGIKKSKLISKVNKKTLFKYHDFFEVEGSVPEFFSGYLSKPLFFLTLA